LPILADHVRHFSVSLRNTIKKIYLFIYFFGREREEKKRKYAHAITEPKQQKAIEREKERKRNIACFAYLISPIFVFSYCVVIVYLVRFPTHIVLSTTTKTSRRTSFCVYIYIYIFIYKRSSLLIAYVQRN